MIDKLRFNLDAEGCGKIVLNGEEIQSNTTGLDISVRAGQIPEVKIFAGFKYGIEGEIEANVKFYNILMEKIDNIIGEISLVRGISEECNIHNAVSREKERIKKEVELLIENETNTN